MQISEAREAADKVQRTTPAGRLLALDLGTKKVGVAISDELRITVRALAAIERRSWKDLLHRVTDLILSHEIRGLVIGLPVRLDGSEGDASKRAREMAEKFQRSINVPLFLQNESLTTFEAELYLKSKGSGIDKTAGQVDSEAAAIILRDFIATRQE